MLTNLTGAKETTSTMDSLEKAEAGKEKGISAPDGMKGGQALDDAIGDKKGPDPEVTSANDDPLEKAEAAKENM